MNHFSASYLSRPPKHNCALVKFGGGLGALPDGGGNDAGANTFLANDVDVLGGESVPPSQIREDVVHGDFDALENRITHNHNSAAILFQDLAGDAAEAICVVEIAGGVVGPAGSAVRTAVHPDISYLGQQTLQPRVLEIERDLLQVADGLPVFSEVLDFELLELAGLVNKTEPEQLGPRVPNVMIVVQIGGLSDNQVN